jgi:hypothetical protein
MQKPLAHEPDTDAPGRGAPATPRVSGEVKKAEASAVETPLPESNTRAASAEEPAEEPSDTLLSAGKPADRLELLLEDRLAVVDGQLRELSARLAVLERKETSSAPEPRLKPWLWIAFLIALVAIFQLLQRLR